MALIIVFLSVSVGAQCNLRGELKQQYRSEIGVREATGHNDGVSVEAYLASTGLGKGYAWCAAFVYWNYVEVGADINIKSPAWSPSWFPESKTIYTRGKGYKQQPQAGDVIGIYFQSKKRIAHVGIYDSENESYIITVEGNTNTKGSREGDGVYRKYRPRGTIYKISCWL